MTKKRSSSKALSPIHPSLHFVLFLVLAFVLVMVVAFVMQQTAKTTRANLFCPQPQANQANIIEELSKRCPQGVKYVKDANKCNVWVCKEAPLAQ